MKYQYYISTRLGLVRGLAMAMVVPLVTVVVVNLKVHMSSKSGTITGLTYVSSHGSARLPLLLSSVTRSIGNLSLELD